MNDCNQLVSLLNKQIEVINNLLDLENTKTNILLKGTIEDLDKILISEQPFIMSSSNIEKQRIVYQKDIGCENYTLKELIINRFSDDPDLLKIFYRPGGLPTA
jgi:hypothetical protein